jgi:hypothetical protein
MDLEIERQEDVTVFWDFSSFFPYVGLVTDAHFFLSTTR